MQMQFTIPAKLKKKHFWEVIVSNMVLSGLKHIQLTIDNALPSDEARTAFKSRLSLVRDLLSPPGGPPLDSLGLTWSHR